MASVTPLRPGPARADAAEQIRDRILDAATELMRNGPLGSGPLAGVVDRVSRLVAQPAEMGSWPTLYAAAMPDVRGAEYFGPDAWGGWRGHPTRTAAARSAYDVDLAAALWQRSQELTGVHFDFAAAKARLDEQG